MPLAQVSELQKKTNLPVSSSMYFLIFPTVFPFPSLTMS